MFAVQPTPQAISSPTTKPGNAPVQVSRNVPQPVPPPTSQSLPSHLKVVPISDSNDTPKADESLTLKSSKVCELEIIILYILLTKLVS